MHFDIPELNALVNPVPALAMHLIYKVAATAPRFALRQPHPKAPRRDRVDWDRDRMKALVSVAFSIDSLHRYFREGLPRDAEPEYYDALDVHNADQVHRLFEAEKTELCLGHVQAHVTLILNHNGEHGSNVFAVCNHDRRNWDAKIDGLLSAMRKYKSAA